MLGEWLIVIGFAIGFCCLLRLIMRGVRSAGARLGAGWAIALVIMLFTPLVLPAAAILVIFAMTEVSRAHEVRSAHEVHEVRSASNAHAGAPPGRPAGGDESDMPDKSGHAPFRS